MYYITIPECAEKLRSEGKTVIEIKSGRPMLTQLLEIPSGSDVMASVPEIWSKAQKERFTLQVHEALTSIEISRNTINAFHNDWEENAFWNYEAAMIAHPVDKLTILDDAEFALIVGAGPSAGNDFDSPVKFQSFVAWSAVDKFKYTPAHIGHCDHRDQTVKSKALSHSIIFTPTASKGFEDTFPDWAFRYVYFDRGNRACWRFAEKRGMSDHEPIVGHVVDMLTNCAIYAGHKVIKFIGVDLCCKTPEEIFKYHPTAAEAIPAVNYRGEEVWTDEIFLSYQRGLEALADRYPEIEFSVLSPDGMIIEGVPYEEP